MSYGGVCLLLRVTPSQNIGAVGSRNSLLPRRPTLMFTGFFLSAASNLERIFLPSDTRLWVLVDVVQSTLRLIRLVLKADLHDAWTSIFMLRACRLCFDYAIFSWTHRVSRFERTLIMSGSRVAKSTLERLASVEYRHSGRKIRFVFACSP